MNTLYIVTTQSCQMSCPFCYCKFIPQFSDFKNEEGKDTSIDTELVKRILNGEMKNDNGEKLYFDYVIFHGGEPLLYPEKIIKIIEENISKVKNFSIQTNLAFKTLSPSQLRALSMCTDGYGTSFNYERFKDNKTFKKYFENNIKELSSLGIYGTVLVTITKDTIMNLNPWALRDYLIDIGIKKVILERPILPLKDLENPKNKKELEELYEEVDKYMEICAKIFPREMTNLFWMVDKCLEHDLFLYNTECSNTTFTLYNDRFKFGCPSLESRNVKNKQLPQCLGCNYFKYCGGDCECFNHVCSFPKRTFDYIKEELEYEKTKK